MKKITTWKSFDFGPETSVDEETPPKVKKSVIKKKTITRNKSSTNVTSRDFARIHKDVDIQKILAPTCVADLAVHNKKIQEVEGWLKFNLSNQQKKFTPFLLVTGPTGSGKTATVQVLCKALGATLLEWINPVDIDFEVFKGSGQVTKFLDFFSESKYNSLFDSEDAKKVIVVKDYPNVFMKNPAEFHSVLEDIYYKCTHPIIFVCTDSNSSELNIQRFLFPEEILLKYAITTYSFNSCAPTLLKKALKRALDLTKELPDFQTPSSATIDAILASSMGDIRSAMNQFLMAALKGSENLPTAKLKSDLDRAGTKRKRDQGGVTLKNMLRDESLGLFHGLGRVLNPKRIEKDGSWRISCDIGKLVDEFSVQPTKFTLFLFENYLRYFGAAADAARAAEILSLSAQLMEHWEHHETLTMSLWMCVLGLMIFNEHKVSKWNQIRGPQKVSQISVQEKESSLTATDRFYYNIITKSNKFHKFS